MERSIGSSGFDSNRRCLIGGSSSEFRSSSIIGGVGTRLGGSISSSLVRSITDARDESAAFGRRAAILTLGGETLPMDRRGSWLSPLARPLRTNRPLLER